jgi:MerR family transcriptional regulator/heat shock protein HspR
MATRRTRTTTTISVSAERGVFMISVAAELAEMHPQTLRMYEARGLIEPKRSAKGTRLYSQSDVERLRRIQRMTAELGLNLAGVEQVLELEAELERLRRRVATLEAANKELRAQLAAALSESSFSLDMIPLPGGGTLVRRVDVQQLGGAHAG